MLLQVSFGSVLGIATGGRHTLSNSIDWAPVMRTHDPTDGRATFGFGIGKSVYLVRLPSTGAAIRHVVCVPFEWWHHVVDRVFVLSVAALNYFIRGRLRIFVYLCVCVRAC